MVIQITMSRLQRRPWWTQTHCFVLGKIQIAVLGISHTLFGLFLFARTYYVFKDMKQTKWGFRLNKAWWLYVISTIVMFILAMVLIGHENALSRRGKQVCRLSHDDKTKVALTVLSVHAVLKVIIYLGIFIVPLWILWSGGNRERERSLMKS